MTTVNGSILEESLIQDTLQNFKPDIIINLAAYPRVSLSEKYPILSADGMIKGLINTLNWPVKKYIHISSSNVYGNYQDDADESSLCAPINLYGSLKIAQEKSLSALSALESQIAGRYIPGGNVLSPRLATEPLTKFKSR